MTGRLSLFFDQSFRQLQRQKTSSKYSAKYFLPYTHPGMNTVFPYILYQAEELAACLHTSARSSQQLPDHTLQSNKGSLHYYVIP